MNSMSRGIRGALRSPLRSGAIILILAISIGLLLAMLVARSSINDKIASVKSQAGTDITINPAGIRGGMGGGTPLTTDQVTKITNTAHVTSTASSLTDQLGASDTNLTSSLTLGSFGQRQMRFEQQGGTAPTGTGESRSTNTNRPVPTPRISATGTNHPETIVTADKLTSGSMISGTSTANVALVGKSLADKNNLLAGGTFTAYGQTFTVAGIYNTGNTFQDSSIIVPLATLQTLTSQAGAVTAVTATVDSADNVASTVSALKTSLGSDVDIASQIDRAAQSAASLETIAGLALDGVIGAAAAGVVIILLAMVIVVRERRREIGIIKAIGGTNRSVVVQLMSEALTLTVISAVIGFALGVVVSGPMTKSLVTNQTASAQTIRGAGGLRGAFTGAGTQLGTNVRNITTSITPTAFGVSIAAVIGMALIGSIIPALLVARIRPAEVLRTE
jgi:putative ABC transport system permease protein